MVAESHGRSLTSIDRSLKLTLFWCGMVAAASELLRGFHPQQAASLLQASIALSASLYGAVIYWLQLSSIQRILAAQAPQATIGSEDSLPPESQRQIELGDGRS
jgi:hypothetical protein